MKLRNELTLTEIRFPNVDTEFGSHQVYEYSTVYPDIQPKLNILHTISIFTSSCTGSFRPSFNLIGQDGESGSRRFNDKVKFSENSRNNIDIDAVNLGMLRELEVQLEGEEVS
uniref:Uncharacterized protein n=1 Tax=Heterorhabditis bacteriophora TaxID=37862 RepID=A0A1I7X1Y3_HETBA